MTKKYSQYRDFFEDKLSQKGIKTITIRTYLRDLEQFLDWLEKTGMEITQVTMQDAEKYLRYLQSPIHTLRPGKVGAYQISTIVRKIKVARDFYNVMNEVHYENKSI
ncbi:MAG: site-specific integrase [Anaerolineaceae bacterium]|nr:site-specific integrase [Anaerolineaceae bacterium]